MLLSQYPDTSLWCVEETWCRKENRSCSCRRKISGLKSVLLHRQESGHKVINYINHVRNAIKNRVHHIANSVCYSLKSSCSNIMSREPTTVTSPTSLLYHNIIKFIHDNSSTGKKQNCCSQRFRKPEARWRLPGWFRCIYFSVTSLQNGRLNHSSCVEHHRIQTRARSNQSILKKNPLRLWVTAKAIQKQAKHSRLSRKWPDNPDSCV